MPKVIDAARVTTRDNAVWRTCSGCGQLAALAPDADRCPACTPTPTAEVAPVFTAAELDEARATLVNACSDARSALDRRHAAQAFLTGYLGSAVTAAVAGEPGTVSLRKAAALYAVQEQVTR